MPIYGYRCSSCGHEVEVLQKFSDPPPKQCPNCGGELVKKVYAAGVIFKGSGFYSTDYKAAKSSDSGSSNGSGSGGEKGSEKTSEKTSEKPGDSKPAAESKTESKAESKAPKSDSSD
jgi:putative FmdB family regulatory protein